VGFAATTTAAAGAGGRLGLGHQRHHLPLMLLLLLLQLLLLLLLPYSPLLPSHAIGQSQGHEGLHKPYAASTVFS